MSTRATYHFKANGYEPAICFYIHHDGYPEGAAEYFHNAVKYWPDARDIYARDSRLASRFFRANSGAEFTEGHDAHGDTEYRYTVDEATFTIICEAREYGDKDTPDTWKIITTQPIAEFIADNKKDIPSIEKPMVYQNLLMTPQLAFERLQASVPHMFLAPDNCNYTDFIKSCKETKTAIEYATGKDPFFISFNAGVKNDY